VKRDARAKQATDETGAHPGALILAPDDLGARAVRSGFSVSENWRGRRTSSPDWEPDAYDHRRSASYLSS